MDKINLRSIYCGKVFAEEFLLDDEVSGWDSQMIMPTEEFELYYKNNFLGIVSVQARQTFPKPSLTLKYITRHIPNQEELLKDWWQGVKTNNQINQQHL